MELTPQAAAQELLRRQAARNDLIAFAKQVDIPGKPINGAEDQFGVIESPVAAHHELLLRTLQRISETPGGRAMVFMPPGSAKSTYTSVVFPAWLMGKRPGYQIILTSYAMDLARKFGRKTRQLVSTKRYRELFHTGLSKSSSAAEEWALENGSEYMASGLLGGVTGNRANGLIIDDPTAGRDEAESETYRNKTLEAYQDDARSRIKPGGWRAIVATRWHEDDLPGSILPEQWGGESGTIRCRDGHDWEVICLPAECDRSDDPLGRPIGGGLWPEWFKPGHWDEFKFPPRSWLSLYQQKPTAEAGTFFKREWFAPHRYTDLPENLSIYMSGDFAVTEGDGDFTEIAVWGIDHADNIYALDWYSGQVTADAWTQAILDRVDRWKPEWFVGETGPIRRAVEPFLMKAMTDRKAYVMVEWLPHGTANKEANARSFQALASVGKVHFPHTEWAERVIDQLLRFPGGKYDDCVDTCSLFGRMLEQTWGAPKKAKKASIDWSAPPELRIADFEPRGSSYA